MFSVGIRIAVHHCMMASKHIKCTRCDESNARRAKWELIPNTKPGYARLCLECGFYIKDILKDHGWNFDEIYREITKGNV